MDKAIPYATTALLVLVLTINVSAQLGRQVPPVNEAKLLLAETPMRITSSAFATGDSIPLKYTCDAKNPPNPPLEFSGVADSAKSLVLIVEDPDVPRNLMPTGVFDHWLMWDLDPNSTGIKEGDNARGLNGTGKAGWVAPCPPDREHSYFFRLYALDVKLGNARIASRRDLEAAMKGHMIEQAELMGKYNRIKK